MRPSSSTSEAGRGLFGGVLARGAVQEELTDRAWLQAMLDVEAALARAEGRAGLLAPDEVERIVAACRAEAFDADALGSQAAATGNPVVPMVRGLREAVGGPAASQVHRGATSQDILDTAAMLVARRALVPVLGELHSAADAAARLAETHRATVMAARTLLQQAAPTTFGLLAASWMSGLDAAVRRLEAIQASGLAVQLGGAAGTLGTLGEAGPTVVRYLALDLGLAEPPLPWHTERTRMAELASALGLAAGAVAKPALDVILLAQTEVGEVREGVAGRGGSSALPHKHNPVAAISAVACARRAPGLVSTLLAAMPQELQRAAGAWQAEWAPLRDLLGGVGAAAAWLADSLEHLHVDAPRMAANLAQGGGVLMAEQLVETLAPHLGRGAAQDVLAAASDEAATAGHDLREVLLARPELRGLIDPAELERRLDPATALGSASIFIDRALAAHAALAARPAAAEEGGA